GWTHTGRVNPGHEVQLTFALRQRGTGRLARLVDAVSDPHSPRYGQYLSLEQVRDLVQPSPATLVSVLKWLQGHGVENCRSVTTLDFLECRMPARRSQTLPLLAAASPSQGSAVQARWWRAECISAWAVMALQTRAGCLPPALGLGANLLPEPLAELQPGAVHYDSPRGQLCCQEELMGELCCRSALCRQGRSRRTSKLLVLVVLLRHSPPSMLSPAFLQACQEPFLAWLLLLSNMSSLPWVHSVSYGDDEDSLSLAYMERVNMEFMKAAARGLTILFASGDDGAGCRRVPGGNHTFRPSFPASSPYVTTVGGTSFKNPFLVTAEVTDYISGGGFSNVFPMPDYQVR
ncbi:Tripeptidyl-peptidase 1, partial [Balearica regulorum gibbericeps]